MSKIKNRLSKKLSIGLMLLAAPMFIVTLGLFFLQSRYLIREEAKDRSNSILKTTILSVRHYMSTIETSTNANAWLMEEHFTPDSLEIISRKILQMNPNILSCSVNAEPDMFPQYGHHFSIYTVREGDTIQSFRETAYEYHEKLWYKTALKAGKPCWVEPFGEHTEGTIDHHEAVASYCRPLRLADGRLAGVVAVDFDFDHLSKTINEAQHHYPDAYFMLVGKDGRFFIHPDAAKLFRKTIFTDTDPLKNADIIALGHEMTEGSKEGTMHINTSGKRYHVCYQPVPGTDWTLALVCPDSEVLTSYHQLAYVMAFVIIIGLLVLLWLTNHVAKLTVSPLNDLLNMTQEIADGNYDETIPHSSQLDLFSRLQDSFATMQQSLKEKMGNIHQAARELRKRNEQQQKAIDMAEAAQKEKDIFIQNVSHQIRTPLNLMLGFMEVLHEQLKARGDNPEALGYLEKQELDNMTESMKHNAVLLKRMILMLYDSSEAGASEERKCKREDELSCNEIAREAIKYTKEHFQGVLIRFETTVPDSMFILTNRVYLTRTLREMLFNAVKHSDRKHIMMRVVHSSTHILFMVQDTGPGLPQDAEEMIDMPFAKVDMLSQGLGLGLPLCKRHAFTLGGELILDPNYHDGCRFILQLPR